MDMTTNIKRQTEIEQNEESTIESKDQYVLILCNDNYNTFEYAMDTLVSTCKHSKEQAEQCAMITHYKGQCDIKLGKIDMLEDIKKTLIEKGLTAIVEKI